MRTFLIAINLLSTSNWKVEEIADYPGYTEPANFIRFINRKVGVRPAFFEDNLHRPQMTVF